MSRNIFKTVYDFAQGHLSKGQERSVKAKKNILISLFVKGGSILISFILVPLTINYINPERYGIWLTLSSIVAWFSFFDIGITHGLRNKFAEAVAKEDYDSAQMYVSTTYGIISIIFIVIWVLFLIINPFLDWSSLLNLSQEYGAEVGVLALIVFTYFCLRFILRTITTVLTADQQPGKASLIDLLGQFIALLTIAVLVKTTAGSLIYLGLALCAAPLLALIGANIFFFSGEYKKYSPVVSKVKFSHAKSLFNLGVIFFVIQIAGIIQFQSANVIISRGFGPEDVTAYNIVYKYFGILNIVFAIFLSPFWTAATDAFFKDDIAWIRKSIKKYNQLIIFFIIGGTLMLFFAESFYDLWLGKDTVHIEFSLSLWCFLFFVFTMFSNIYVSFLNGISALKLQFWTCILSPILYVVLAILFIQYYRMGVYALFVASIIANFNGIILAPIQYYMVVVKKKKGIWIK